MQIATAKDLDFLLAQLKGDKNDALLMAVVEVQDALTEAAEREQSPRLTPPEEQKTPEALPSALTSDTFLTPATTETETVAAQPGQGSLPISSDSVDPNTKQTLKDRAAKIYKQHAEIIKLKSALETAIEEKKQLEDEVRSRSDEVYKMNEKMIFLEYERQAEASKLVTAMASGKV